MNVVSKPVDIRLKYIQPKAIWGNREIPGRSGILAIGDNEYVAAVGNGIMTFDNKIHGVKTAQLVESHHPDVLSVSVMTQSSDLKYLATVVNMKGGDENSVYILVYLVENLSKEAKVPKLIQYQNKSFVAGGCKIESTCLEFSNDVEFLACGTTVPSIGIIIFDHRRGTVFQTISTESSPYHISFNPLDSSKICVTGEGGLFKFWRFTSKTTHVAPVVGLKGKNVNYTHHIWVPPYSDGLVIAGTQGGYLCQVLGCEQRNANVYAFGTANPQSSCNNNDEDEQSVSQILVRGDVLIAISAGNRVGSFELRRVMQNKGINSMSPTIAFLKTYRLSKVDRLLGVQWCIQNSISSFTVVAMCATSIFQVDLFGNQRDSVAAAITNSTSGSSDAIDGRAPSDNIKGSAAAEFNSNTRPNSSSSNAANYVDIREEVPIFQFHGDTIQSLSLSYRSNSFITNSFRDGTVRVWDYNTPSSFGGTWLVENYKDRPEDNPFQVAMHPSGLITAFAMEGEVREYAITDCHLELYRRISVKAPFIGPTGTAHLVTQPVSLVKYSHGGQYMAVVTGKIAQIFHTNITDYHTTTKLAGKYCHYYYYSISFMHYKLIFLHMLV